MAQLSDQLSKKQRQLARQKERDRGTILLLDTYDLAHLNEAIAWEGLGRAAEGQDISAIDWVMVYKELRDRRGSRGFFLWPLRYRGVQHPDDRWMREFLRAQGAARWPQDEWHGPLHPQDVG